MFKYFVLFLSCLCIVNALNLANFEEITESNFAANGNARVLWGKLGHLSEVDAVLPYLYKYRESFGFKGTEQFEVVKIETDDRLGNLHYRIAQKLRDVEVIGGDFIIHVNPETLEVFSFGGSYLIDEGEYTVFEERINLIEALREIKKSGLNIASNFEALDVNSAEIRRVIFLDEENEGHYAYELLLDIAEQDELIPNLVYIDTKLGKLVAHIAQRTYALQRTVYNANQKTSLPGTEICFIDDVTCTSNVMGAEDAWTNSGITWAYYKFVFNRDSYDNQGTLLRSSVNYGVNYNNAFWNNVQMVYGNGDGVTFENFAGDLSVVAHELSHAVTSATSNLRYLGQSGALNEGFSDMMGASTVIWQNTCDWSGQTTYSCDTSTLDPTKDWDIGSICYIVTPEAALRYMANPALDGVSRDYFPDRYTGFGDNGGVHINSGIANLQFVLLADGGVHPQQKTSVYVAGIGYQDTRDLWYQANTVHFTETTNFADARAQLAGLGSTLGYNVDIINNAWTAVGVNGN